MRFRTRSSCCSAVEAFRTFIGPFAQTLVRSAVVAAFGDDDAVVICDTKTVAVEDAPPPST